MAGVVGLIPLPWQVVVPNDQVELTAGDEVRVVVPAGATAPWLADAVEATAMDPAAVETVHLPDGTTASLGADARLVGTGPRVRLEPDGARFAEPVAVTIEVEAAEEPALGHWILIGEAVGDDTRWTAAPEDDVTVDPQAGTVTVRLRHFTDVQPVTVVPRSPPRPSKVKRRATREEVWRMRRHLVRYIYRFDDTCFGSLVSLGDPDLFLSALDDVEVVIDPEGLRGDQGRMSGNGQVLSIREPPAAFDLNYATTLWHELVHHIEVVDHSDRWTIYVLDLTGETYRQRAERHTEYMERVSEELGSWATFERAAENRSIARLRRNFDNKRDKVRSGSQNTFAPVPDLEQLEDWTGFRVDFDAVEAHYASGACGDKLREAFAGRERAKPPPAQPRPKPRPAKPPPSSPPPPPATCEKTVYAFCQDTDARPMRPCYPGFCWHRGQVACVQRELPANARWNMDRGVLCKPGYEPDRDPCTGLVRSCTKK